MADRAAADALINEIDGWLAEQLNDAIRRTLASACAPYECTKRQCDCVYDVVHRKDDVGFWSPINWPAMVTVLDDEIVELVGEFNRNTGLSASWVRGVRSGQINQLGGFCRGVKARHAEEVRDE